MRDLSRLRDLRDLNGYFKAQIRSDDAIYSETLIN